MPVFGRPGGPKKRIIVVSNGVQILLEIVTLAGIFLIFRSLNRIENNLSSPKDTQRLNEE